MKNVPDSCFYHPADTIEVETDDKRVFTCGCYYERAGDFNAFTVGAHKRTVELFSRKTKGQ